MPNRIDVEQRAKEVHELWICHYGYKNAWKLSKALRKLFWLSGKKRKKEEKEEKKKKTQTAGYIKNG